MKKIICAVALSALTLCASPVFAENTCPPPGGPDKKTDFASMKADIQEMLSGKIARDQKALACVNAAQNIEALEACRPRHPHCGRR
jgi:hypothetical protein